jgi:hypothetical protein
MDLPISLLCPNSRLDLRPRHVRDQRAPSIRSIGTRGLRGTNRIICNAPYDRRSIGGIPDEGFTGRSKHSTGRADGGIRTKASPECARERRASRP